MRDRHSLMRTFWWYAGEIGRERAYDVIEGLYRIRSLSRLTDDEIEAVIAEIKVKSGIKTTRKKKRTGTNLTKGYFQAMGYRVVISDAQMKKISVLYDRSGVTRPHFQELLEHVAPEGYLGPKQAGKVIGALSNLIERKNKPEQTVTQPAPGNQQVKVKKSGFIYYEFKPGHG